MLSVGKVISFILSTSIFLSFNRIVQSFTGMFTASSRIMRSISGLLGNQKESGSNLKSSVLLEKNSPEKRLYFTDEKPTTTRENRCKSPRTQIRELTAQNAAAYYRNAGFGNPTLQHIENYSASVDDEEHTNTTDKHFLGIMVRAAFESVTTMLTPVKNRDEAKKREIVEEFTCAPRQVKISPTSATIKGKETDATGPSLNNQSSGVRSVNVNIPGFMDFDPKNIMKARNNKQLEVNKKSPGMMFDHNISPDNVWYDLK